MGTKKVLFRRKFRGYDRRAVNDYILEMNRSFSEESRERDGALADAEKTLSESRERLASLEEALKAREDAASADSERIAGLERELAALRAQSEEERTTNEHELAALRTQNEEERAAHEHELAGLEAQLSALKAEYDLAARERIAALGASCDQMRERMSAELRELTKKCLREVLSGVAGMRDDIGRVQTASGARADRMIRSIDEYEADMKNEVRRLLNEFRTDGLE